MANTKSKDDPFVRFAIWKGYKKRCYLCHKPLAFGEVNIDHILPESLKRTPNKFKEVLIQLSLPSDFNLNNYENFALICNDCNKKKSDVIDNILTKKYLVNAKKLEPQLEKIEQRKRQEVKKLPHFTEFYSNERRLGNAYPFFKEEDRISISQLKELQDQIIDENINILDRMVSAKVLFVMEEFGEVKEIFDEINNEMGNNPNCVLSSGFAAELCGNRHEAIHQYAQFQDSPEFGDSYQKDIAQFEFTKLNKLFQVTTNNEMLPIIDDLLNQYNEDIPFKLWLLSEKEQII